MPVKKKDNKKKVIKNVAQKGSSISKSKSSAKSNVIVKIDQRKITKGRSSVPSVKHTTTFIGSSPQPYYPPQPYYSPQPSPSINFAPVVSAPTTSVSEKYPGIGRIIGEMPPTANYMNRTPFSPNTDIMNLSPETQSILSESSNINNIRSPQRVLRPLPSKNEIGRVSFPVENIVNPKPSTATPVIKFQPEEQTPQTSSFENLFPREEISSPQEVSSKVLKPSKTSESNKDKTQMTRQPLITPIRHHELPVRHEEDVSEPPITTLDEYSNFGLTHDELGHYAYLLNTTPEKARSTLRQRIYERKGARNLEPKLQREISLQILAKSQKKYENQLGKNISK
jgi:hypothetical protein